MEGMPLEKIPEDSYLRMYLTYIHYYGIKNFIKAFEKREAVKKELNA